MQKEIQMKATQVDNLEKENDQLMSKIADLIRRDKNHEENLKQARQNMQSEVNLLNSRLVNTQVLNYLECVTFYNADIFFCKVPDLRC